MKSVGLLLLLFVGATEVTWADDRPTFEGKDAAGWAALFENPREAFAARDRLGASGKTGVPIAAELFASASPIVRGWACWVVEALGQDAVALHGTVADLLSDPEPAVREEAVGAVDSLVDSLGPRVIEPVRKILREDGWRSKGRAADVLKSLGSRAIVAIPDLVVALQTAETYCIDNCAQALLAMGDPGVGALARVWPGLDKERRGPVRDGIADSSDAAAPALVRLLDSTDAAVADTAEELAVAAGWRILPELARERRTLPPGAVDRAPRVRERVLREGSAAYMQPRKDDVLEARSPLELDPATLELSWETGSGHGQSLARYRTRRADGDLFVRAVAFSAPSLGNPRAMEQVRVRERGPIPADRFAAACEMLARVVAMGLVARPRAPGEHGRSFTTSSADFHDRVRISSGGATLFAESFTGYSGSLSHRESCRVEAAVRVLTELLSMPGREVAADESDRADLFARCATLHDDEWWVKTRLLRTVSWIGDKRFEPLLRAYIVSEPREYPWDHAAAIDAYARIFGLDLRTTPFERDDVPVVRKRYLEKFRELEKK